MLNLSWAKHEDVRWFGLESVDLSDLHITGVYIIWHAGQASRVVTIGSGDIAARLLTRRTDKAISAYKAQGELLVRRVIARFVSWCTIVYALALSYSFGDNKDERN